MIYKTVSMSLLLAISLSMSACGGENKNNSDSNNSLSSLSSDDKNAPIFDSNSITERTIPEGTTKDVATYTVTDENNINFSLQGADADDFSLAVAIVNSKYKVTLKLKNMPDFEQKNNYNVTLVATDEKGNISSKDITVNIEDKPFSFNVTGNMGATVAGETNTMKLAVEEPKSDVTYNIIGANFTLNDDTVTFTAPAYKEGQNNIYLALATADDGNSKINLTLKATVIKDANATPQIKTYLLKSQRDIGDFDTYTLYEYTYDSNNYLSSIKKTGTNVLGYEMTSFEYSDNYKIMKGYKEPGHRLKSIRIFEDKKTNKNKFAANDKIRLSSDEYVNYMSNVTDTVALKNNRHLTKYIHGLEFSQKYVELYVYNDNDQLSRILTGSYTINADIISTMTDAQLNTQNAPSGGFPAGNTQLTTAQLNSLNSGLLPVRISHETTYVYNNGILSERKYFGYAKPETKSDPITVTYYANNAIKSIKSSSGVTVSYNTESLLDSINNYKYSYSQNSNNTKVTVNNENKIITTYIFEEE